MIWSRLKKQSEELLAASLRGRVKYYLTSYGSGVSYHMTRGWITLDGREILNCSTIKQVRESYHLTGEWYSQEKTTVAALHRQGLFTRQEYVAALEEYIGNPIETVLQSANPLARAIILLDRRIGKRRLRKMSFHEDEFQVVKDFYRIRSQAENLTQTIDGNGQHNLE